MATRDTTSTKGVQEMKTYINKSKAGHYTVTICKAGSTWPVFKQSKIGSLEAARSIAAIFISTAK
jgi:hypothetical protein